jgi:hypothetical protein
MPQTHKTNIAILLAICFAAPVYAADNGCKQVFDAMSKVLVTPTHLYSSEGTGSSGNKTNMSEMIYSGGANTAIYILIGAKWTRSKMDGAAMAKQEEENRRNSKYSCRYVRDEAVNGEPAAVYASHAEIEGMKSDATTWISKSKGLPLRVELDHDPDDPISKSHTLLRYEYTNVRPPAGVQ